MGRLGEFKVYPKYLKYIRPVILNSFQDLTLFTNRDAEPSSA
jgi:hypothetical protein